jgi:4-hydroxy-tetrahydrodipicolinate synthase
VVLYNIPGRSVINLGPELMASLASSLDNVVAVKQANRDELAPIDGLALLAGDDDVFLRCLEVGGVGGVLVASNLVPAEMRAIYDAATSDDVDRARELDDAVRPLYAALPVAPLVSSVKAVLEERGMIGGALRLPMVPATESERKHVREALQTVAIL